MEEVYIVAAKRTPIGSFGGTLSKTSATELGAIAIKSCFSTLQISTDHVDEVFMGNVLSANLGQAPARQAALKAEIPHHTPCTTINKVCASGMKAITLAAQSILTGDNNFVVAGGMENMSQTPYYSPSQRFGSKFGNTQLIDGMVKDGLTDVYNDLHMGNAAELCATKYNIDRTQQDSFSISSYKKSQEAGKNGFFTNEIAPVELKQRDGSLLVIDTDEEYSKVNFDKIPLLKSAFIKDGTITAANASTLNDGAAAVVLCNKSKLNKLSISPLAKIISYADAAQDPKWFTTSPALSITKALEKANLTINDIDAFELNEAFAVVGIANQQLLNIPKDKININGGAVSLGHPLGCSGTRIVVTLISVLKQIKGKYGVASICNGGGGATAIIIENLDI